MKKKKNRWRFGGIWMVIFYILSKIIYLFHLFENLGIVLDNWVRKNKFSFFYFYLFFIFIFLFLFHFLN